MEWLDKYVLGSSNEPITHTSMSGGKYHVPQKKLKSFYKNIHKHVIEGGNEMPLVEKMGEFFPLVLDFDLKYKSELEERQYTDESIQETMNFLWATVSDCLEVDDIQKFGTIFLMEKDKPYPCKKQGYKMKDGIHIAFPNIIIKKSAFKNLIKIIQSAEMIQKIFIETSDIGPDNDDKNIVDSSFSSWQLYGCGKVGESPYKLTQVFRITETGCAEKLDDETFETFYSDPRQIMKDMTMCYRTEDNVEYKDIIVNGLKPSTSVTSSSGSMTNNDDIYGGNNIYYVDNNNEINRFQIVEEEELKLVKSLVNCLSADRAEDYELWLHVGMCLHNINRDLLPDWKKFSQLGSSYEEGECDRKWASFNSDHGGQRLGIGSLNYWAKHDNESQFIKAKNASLATFIDKSVRSGADADYLVAKVIHKYYKDEFISVNVKDEWFHFNGVRWERTLEGTTLKTKIHSDIYNLYYEYQKVYHDKKQQEIEEMQANGEDPTEVMEGKSGYGKLLRNIMTIQMKLLQGNYVNGLMKNVRDLFYEKEIMEKFDTDNNLIGFENGIYDLKNSVFRGGRPEDYVTLSTKVSLPVDASQLPIKLDVLLEHFQTIENYSRFDEDMLDFIAKIVPVVAVRDYTMRFMSKCLSGENRDEGFYIWTGTGGNGKSKLIDLMCMCLGEYACNLPIALLTQKRKASGAASPEMARTRGKRFCVMQEPDVNETLNVGEMKEITGNDKIQARGLYKEPFEFTPQFKLLCMCNDLPRIPSNDDGTWRRLEVVDFIAKFVDSERDVDPNLNRYLKDKSIKNKIPMWVIPFYAILFKEWREYDTHGIEIPAEVRAKTNEYRNNNDIVGQWIAERCVEADNEISTDGITESAPTEFAILYSEFAEWCDSEEIKNRPDKKGTKEALKKWQSKSRFGLSIGKKNEGLPNGWEANPKFNLKMA